MKTQTKFPDWRGSLKKRFRWRWPLWKSGFEFGRYCYVMDRMGMGIEREVWWEWEL